MMRVRDFLPMQSPLIVGTPDGPVVALAFLIDADGALGCFVVPFDGGTADFLPIEATTFPPPIRTGPAATSVTELGRAERRAAKFRKGMN